MENDVFICHLQINLYLLVAFDNVVSQAFLLNFSIAFARLTPSFHEQAIRLGRQRLQRRYVLKTTLSSLDERPNKQISCQNAALFAILLKMPCIPSLI